MTNRQLDTTLAELSRQRRAFARLDVFAAGGTDKEILLRLRARAIVQLAEGVYADPAHPATWLQRVEAARLEAGPDALACRWTAAALHGFVDFWKGEPHILVPFGSTNHGRLAAIHQSRLLTPADRTLIHGIPTTSVDRTIIDLAGELSPVRLQRLIEGEVISGKLDVSRLGEHFLSLARRGLKGTRKLRAVLQECASDSFQPLQSELEALLLRRLQENGLPAPVRQFHLPWRPPENGWVDFAYPPFLVLLEADGRNWHTRLEQMASDRQRDREVQLHGMRLFRYTWHELLHDPCLVAELRPVLR
jgi:very-short-patch-repair endonuclease